MSSGRVAGRRLPPHRLGAQPPRRPADAWSTITGANVGPDHARLARRLRPLAGARPRRLLRRDRRRGLCQARHDFPTRLTVIDKLPAEDPTVFPASPGIAPDVATLLDWIERAGSAASARRSASGLRRRSRRQRRNRARLISRARDDRPASRPLADPEGVELAYETVDWTPPEGARLTDAHL